MSSTAVRLGPHGLAGELQIPAGSITGLVIFAHGSGSSRLSPRNQYVARALQAHGLVTLLFDLLTDEEALDRRNVFDIELLARRLGDALIGSVTARTLHSCRPASLVPAPERQRRWSRRQAIRDAGPSQRALDW
jgi:fermentation-respiration switch protein FrsA (DUF1100 family)